ncbi:MAG: DUF1499 domain-containing protein [bacterium]
MFKEQNNILIFALTGLCLAAVFALTAVLAGLGTRWSFWDFRAGLKIFRWSSYAEAVIFVLTLAGLILAIYKQSQHIFIFSLTGFLISVTVAGTALKWMYVARHVPAIHDITTDIENPPQFDAVLALRKNAPNSSEYPGGEISVMQRKAYPGIGPFNAKLKPDKAYELCLAAAKEMGWKIVNAKRDAGFIEATDETFWFGFKDDIAIRITPFNESSRIDLRSVSRVGRSDVGTNAKRIQKFFKRLRDKI